MSKEGIIGLIATIIVGIIGILVSIFVITKKNKVVIKNVANFKNSKKNTVKNNNFGIKK